MSLRLVLVCLGLLTVLSGCLTAPADIQEEFERNTPNNYRPVGVIDQEEPR